MIILGNPYKIRMPTWQTSFDPGAGDTNSGNFTGVTICNLIPAGSQTVSGSKVRITFERGTTGSGVTILSASISEQAASGDAFDSHTDLTQILFSGLGTTTIVTPDQLVCDELTYTFDHTKNHLVSLAVGGASSIARVFNFTGANYYYKAGSEAQTQNRSSYSTEANVLFGIALIEVFS